MNIKKASFIFTGIGLAGLFFHTNAAACAAEPLIGSVCVMGSNWAPEGFKIADGSALSINQYAALYSIVGTMYGTGAQGTFKIPDLRGRVALGAGVYQQGAQQTIYNVGQSGGASTTTLTVNNIPIHNHAISGLSGVIDFTKVTATTTLAGVTAKADGSTLVLNSGANFAANSDDPSNATFGSQSGNSIYVANVTPSVPLKAGSISGVANVLFQGNPTTTLSGNAPIAINGQTGNAGLGAAFNSLNPYVAMTYLIAVQGIYPTRP